MAANADQQAREIELLRALTQAQLAQITETTRRLVEAEARQGASLDARLLQAGTEALDRRLQDSQALALGRESALAAQILADGTALMSLTAARDAALDAARKAATDQASITADREARITALMLAADAARAESAALRQDLARIYRSSSWRLTEPLRAARRLLGW